MSTWSSLPPAYGRSGSGYGVGDPFGTPRQQYAAPPRQQYDAPPWLARQHPQQQQQQQQNSMERQLYDQYQQQQQPPSPYGNRYEYHTSASAPRAGPIRLVPADSGATASLAPFDDGYAAKAAAQQQAAHAQAAQECTCEKHRQMRLAAQQQQQQQQQPSHSGPLVVIHGNGGNNNGAPTAATTAPSSLDQQLFLLQMSQRIASDLLDAYTRGRRDSCEQQNRMLWALLCIIAVLAVGLLYVVIFRPK